MGNHISRIDGFQRKSSCLQLLILLFKVNKGVFRFIFFYAVFFLFWCFPSWALYSSYQVTNRVRFSFKVSKQRWWWGLASICWTGETGPPYLIMQYKDLKYFRWSLLPDKSHACFYIWNTCEHTLNITDRSRGETVVVGFCKEENPRPQQGVVSVCDNVLVFCSVRDTQKGKNSLVLMAFWVSKGKP